MRFEYYLILVIVVTFFTAVQAFPVNSQHDVGALGRNRSFVRVKREDESCSFNEHECADGLCIRANPECDGVYDCGDGSDEAFSLCRTRRINEFRCNYGACVHRVYVCDGNRDCVDNSDELLSICTGGVWIVREQFKCRSGQLIPLQSRCNGVVDCRDGTDESVAACAELVCHSEQFQCEYGGCVEGAAMCNGTAECRDGSDELLEICGKTTLVWSSDLDTSTADSVIRVRKCVLPQQPENGVYRIVSETDPDNADYLYLEYTCFPGFELVGEDRAVCWRGIWPELPHCVPAPSLPRVSNESDLHQGSSELEKLPSKGYNNSSTEKENCTLTRHKSIEYLCYDEDKVTTRPCGTEEADGTIVRPQCKEYYYSPVELPYMQCSRGLWSSSLVCTPECGTLTVKVTPLISGGEEPQFGDVPWHIGVYRKERSSSHYVQICGGSLISSTVVLSAAHCFWDEKLKQLDGEDKYAVAAGKLHSDWDDPKDERFAQKSNVSKILVSHLYRGIELDYHHDIAVVLASQPFTYKLHVRPVCLDFRAEFNAEQLKEGRYGKFAGWSFNTESRGSMSNELKMIELPYVDQQNCLNRTSGPYLHYNVSDKICAGSLEAYAALKSFTGHRACGNAIPKGGRPYCCRVTHDGEILCGGDRGGGLYFSSNVSGVERYYLRGIASIRPSLKEHFSCNIHSLTSFTAIIQYEEFIKQHLYSWEGL